MGTIEYIDGFDDYIAGDGTLHGWSSNASAMVAGRVEGQALRINNNSMLRSVGADARYTATCAMWFSNLADGHANLMRFREGGAIHGLLAYNGDGTFTIKRGTATLATSINCNLIVDVPFTLEWDYNVHDTTGSFELRVNKVVVIDPTTGQDTRDAGGASGVITAFDMGSTGDFIIDDLILTKGGGFQGDVRVVTDFPDGDGANTDWTAVPYGNPAYIGQAVGTGTGAVTLGWPTHKPDDVGILLVEACGGEAVTLTTASGFVELSNSPQATGSGTAGTRIHAYWCRATTNDMDDVVIGDPGDHLYATILTFRGCLKVGDPVDVTAGAVKTPATTSFSSPTVTTTVDNCLVLACIARDDDVATAEFSAWTNATLASITEVFDLGTTNGNGGGLGVGVGIMASAGATGATTGTVVNSINASLTIALKPGLSTDYLQVKEIFENGDDDYLSSSTATDRDTFTFPDVGVVGTVKAVAINHISRKDDAGTRKIAGSIRVSTTDYDGTGLEVSTSWAAYQEIHEVDPSTSAAWDVGDIDTAEFGIYLDT